jgi:hypothetical protein
VNLKGIARECLEWIQRPLDFVQWKALVNTVDTQAGYRM